MSQLDAAVEQAEDGVFKVHMSLLARESGFFASLATVKQPEGQEEGTETMPLVVPHVSARALANLLHIVYLPWGEPLERATEELIPVIHAAQRYQFDRVFKVVVKRLCVELSADQRLELAMACSIQPWIKREFVAVVLGFDSVPLDTAKLDVRTVSKIWKARHKVAALRLKHATALADSRRHAYYRPHGHAPPGVSSGELCGHLNMQAVKLVAETPRELFLKTLRERVDLKEQLKSCAQCRSATQAAIEAYAGPVPEEVRLVQEIWDE
ncbi:hypothetical protein AURDEDRAFT_170408 [Auricularia subglabra TFB-10046 SS5]|nr:hypothetical protein AURDEDRAFT_170408 [Auricularia subglabra TFB-10046 SS5]